MKGYVCRHFKKLQLTSDMFKANKNNPNTHGINEFWTRLDDLNSNYLGSAQCSHFVKDDSSFETVTNESFTVTADGKLCIRVKASRCVNLPSFANWVNTKNSESIKLTLLYVQKLPTFEEIEPNNLYSIDGNLSFSGGVAPSYVEVHGNRKYTTNVKIDNGKQSYEYELPSKYQIHFGDTLEKSATGGFMEDNGSTMQVGGSLMMPEIFRGMHHILIRIKNVTAGNPYEIAPRDLNNNQGQCNTFKFRTDIIESDIENVEEQLGNMECVFLIGSDTIVFRNDDIADKPSVDRFFRENKIWISYVKANGTSHLASELPDIQTLKGGQNLIFDEKVGEVTIDYSGS